MSLPPPSQPSVDAANKNATNPHEASADHHSSGTTEMIGSAVAEEKPSYTKLAMRNMVRKGGTSLTHFFLTAAGLFALLIGLAYLTH